jgi:tRNA-specific 2-thiouridylase
MTGADGRAELRRAIDDTKDQSYFLFATTQEQLDFLRFPLGGWTKDITRAHAERLGLINAEKPDSQDICFVPGGDYAKVVRKLRPAAGKPGNIVHIDGRVLGRHEGIIGYTIGQRKGLGIGGGHSDGNDPFYVVRLDLPSNEVVVGPKEALARDVIYLKECNWLDHPVIRAPIMIKFRSMMKPVAATLHNDEIHLHEPQYGISPGQAAVCYMNDRVIGGGWIAGTGNQSLALAA